MKLGMIGLGKMGGNMAERLRRHGHDVVGMDPSADGADARTLDELIPLLDADGQPRIAWVMVPAGPITDDTITQLAERLAEGDVVIDGGNSNYTDSQRHGALLADHGIGFVDCGTSGGVWGLEEGYSLMVGGSDADVATAQPIFDALAPEHGFAHCGPVGAGHYVKMVHNGVEYGIMQAYAEGFELMYKSKFPIELKEVADLWMQGSVVRSWLLELAGRAFAAEGNDLENIKGYVSDSGEGRWSIADGIDLDVPTPVITASLYARFYSRGNGDYTHRVLAALRNQFGGHAVERTGG